MIPFNPEFRRQIWLEFSTMRLIGMPVVLGLIFYLASLGDDPGKTVGAATYLYFIIVILWGNFRAVNSLHDEVQENTWDFQKMSPQSAWSLVIGKLFGATSYVWYGGFMCLAVLLYQLITTEAGADKSAMDIAHLFLIYIGVGILGHTAGLIFCLQDISYRLMKGRMAMAAYTILAIVLSSSLFGTANVATEVNYKYQDSVNWFGMDYNPQIFQLMTLAFFVFWALIGLYRSMRKELQYRDGLIAWLSFLVTLILYFTGFADEGLFGDKINLRKGVIFANALFISGSFVYIWAYLEARDTVAYKRFFNAIKAKDWFKTYENLPKWILTSAVMMLSWIGLLTIGPDVSNFEGYYIFLTALILFMCRDLGVLHLLFFSKKNRRAPLTFILYMAVFYIILPLIENTSNPLSAKGWGIFLPIPGENAFLGLGPISIQLLIVGTLVKKQWLSKEKKVLANN